MASDPVRAVLDVLRGETGEVVVAIQVGEKPENTKWGLTEVLEPEEAGKLWASLPTRPYVRLSLRRLDDERADSDEEEG